MEEQYIYITGSLSIFHQNIIGYYDLLDLNIRNHEDESELSVQLRIPISELLFFFWGFILKKYGSSLDLPPVESHRRRGAVVCLSHYLVVCHTLIE